MDYFSCDRVQIWNLVVLNCLCFLIWNNWYLFFFIDLILFKFRIRTAWLNLNYICLLKSFLVWLFPSPWHVPGFTSDRITQIYNWLLKAAKKIWLSSLRIKSVFGNFCCQWLIINLIILCNPLTRWRPALHINHWWELLLLFCKWSWNFCKFSHFAWICWNCLSAVLKILRKLNPPLICKKSRLFLLYNLLTNSITILRCLTSQINRARIVHIVILQLI